MIEAGYEFCPGCGGFARIGLLAGLASFTDSDDPHSPDDSIRRHANSGVQIFVLERRQTSTVETLLEWPDIRAQVVGIGL